MGEIPERRLPKQCDVLSGLPFHLTATTARPLLLSELDGIYESPCETLDIFRESDTDGGT